MRSFADYVRGVRHPEAFHGRGVRRGYFEGWYIKLVSADLSQRWAVIPGVFRGLADAQGERDEAFVQVLDGLTGRSWYHRFDPADFVASSDRFEVSVGGNTFDSSDRFEVSVGGNTFDASGVTLDLPQLRGSIRYSTPLQPWPVTLREPGIMGWYGLVPFMECFHGIVSFGHGLSGTLEVEGAPTSFNDGRGYIEKDWGQAFPAGYVWMASNHIDAINADGEQVGPEASFIGSVAIIPWLGRAFRGFIVGLQHGERLHRWTTYSRARERRLEIDDTHVRWSLEGRDGILELEAERVRGGLLHAPLRTAMHQRVEETLDARITLRHTDHDGRTLLEGTALAAGLEVFGDTDRLLGL